MKHGGAVALLLVAAALAGCRDAGMDRNNTAVLGGGETAGAPSALTDAQGRAIPAPPVPAKVQPQVAHTGDEAAVAAWIADHHVVASRWTRASGWSTPQALERIYGESSQVALAGNGRGQAMAVWHHRVGNIHSLRYSLLQGDAWTQPDVLPGALPRPDVAGTPEGHNMVQLQMDAAGNVQARWPSGFHSNEDQVARYASGAGWSHAATEALASAQSASPATPAPSSAR